jgi:hypothetical protein
MRRGWTTPYKYLSEKRQREMLVEAGIEERGDGTPIYKGHEWADFIRALRRGDEAVVADLRVFGSRRRLGEASAEIAAKGATLVTAAGTQIHHPTLADVQRTESLWAKHRGIGGSAQAKKMNAKAYAARIAKRDAERLPDTEARAIWLDVKRYPLSRDALTAMKWPSYVTAWRAFGPRE